MATDRPRKGEVHAADRRRRATLEAHSDTALSYVFNSSTPIIMVSPSGVVRRAERRLVHSRLGAGAVGRSPTVGAGGHLLDSAELAAALRDLRADLRRHAAGTSSSATRRAISAPWWRRAASSSTDGLHLRAVRRRRPSGIRRRCTYGYAATVTWTPWTGWAVGFGFGLAFGAAVQLGIALLLGLLPGALLGRALFATARTAPPMARTAAAARGGRAAGRQHRATCTTSGARPARSRRTSGGYNAWTGNAWSNQVGHSYNSVTGRSPPASVASVQNVYTGNYAYGGAAPRTTPRRASRRGAARSRIGNAYTGHAEHRDRGRVTGPGRTVGVGGEVRRQLLRRPRRQRLHEHRQQLADTTTTAAGTTSAAETRPIC